MIIVNNFKVEKTIKSSLYRDRARIQVGRISMFGLLELSRQRLRSSLIDKTFDKCNFCNGSGLILNASAISEQIINVIKEKISQEKDVNVDVKCNTSLAETLINNKNQEIANLEKNYNTKINFIFDFQFSLHEPLVELSKKNKIEIKIKDNSPKIKKKVLRKKSNLNKKIIKTKKNTNISKKKETITESAKK